MKTGSTSRDHQSGHRLARVIILVIVVLLLCLILKHHRLAKVKTTIKEEEKQLDLGCLYTVIPPTNPITWKEIIFYIKPSPGGICKGVFRHNVTEGQSKFRIQAFGSKEMVTGTAMHVGNDTYEAKLQLSFADEYIFMVILTFLNKNHLEYRVHHNAILQHVVSSPFESRVAEGTRPAGYTRYCTREESGTAPGRWVECGKLEGIEDCGEWQLNQVYDFDQIHGFHWVPFSCQLHHYSNDEIKKCFAKNGWSNIAFTGDSHMRYRTYHWVTRLYGGCRGCIKTHIKMVFDKIPRIEWIFDARGTRWPMTFPDVKIPNEVYVHPKTRRSMFSKELPSTVFDVKLFIMNFGHWVLREITQKKFMQDKLNAFAEAIQKMNGTDGKKRFLWVNTVSLPWRDDKAVVDWIENPSPARVEHWNKLSDSVMRKHGIQIVDAFQISNSRIGATHDQTHYAKRMSNGDCGGVVENAISNTIANALCNFKI
ncbi:uncharacterized protein LOC110233383 isoform X2 [Exaiptasia diaphana]|nr:uncharacterized protein LOC110233383 isoform X2 [Exaiptasia diaphana]KXJ17732.1 hypothetical protein AC249_AIPGENE12041 [Exaiptasia diaphana]